MASRSRSAGSPALPTAMTTRPQLASSPAMAVLTKGLSAMALAMRKALSSETAPSTWMETCLVAPSPSRTTWMASSNRTSQRASPKISARGSSRLRIGSTAALPVAKASSVSEVEVSLSTVMELKLVWLCLASRACSTSAAIGMSVTTKLSMVAMSGAIMPEPLAMPLIRTSTPSISSTAPESLG
ncbi:hypothetical protein D9M68_805270 [compost metagenome]